MYVHLLAKMDSSPEAYGKVDITYCGVAPPPFLALEEPFCACVVRKVSLTSRMRYMWSLYLLSGQDSAPLCSSYYLCLGVSVHRRQSSAAQPGAHLSPALNPPGIIHSCTYSQPLQHLNPQVSAITSLIALPCKLCFEGLATNAILQCRL